MVLHVYLMSENVLIAAADSDALVLMIHVLFSQFQYLFANEYSDMIKENMQI